MTRFDFYFSPETQSLFNCINDISISLKYNAFSLNNKVGNSTFLTNDRKKVNQLLRQAQDIFLLFFAKYAANYKNINCILFSQVLYLKKKYLLRRIENDKNNGC